METNLFLRTTFNPVKGLWGIWASDLSFDKPLVSLNAEHIFASASTIKLPILIELYRQVIDEGLALSTPLTATDEYRANGSGILWQLSSQVTMTLKDLATLMMQFSDNTAANLLVAVLGRDNINQTMRQLGLSNTNLYLDRIDPELLRDDPAALATTTPRDMATLLAHLALGNILTPNLCREILGLMKRDVNKRRLCGLLPYRQDLTIYHKTGTLTGVYNDVGIIEFSKGKYVVSVLSKDVTDVSDDPRDNRAERAIAEFARCLFDYMDANL